MIKTEPDFINAQKKLINLQLVLADAKRSSKDKMDYEMLYKSILFGIKNIENDIYDYLSRY